MSGRLREGQRGGAAGTGIVARQRAGRVGQHANTARCIHMGRDWDCATEIRLLAERQMGEFLKAMPKAKGGANYHAEGSARTPINCESSATVTTRGELGILHHQARRAQKLADIPAPEFRERIETAKTGRKPSLCPVVTPTWPNV